MELWRPWSHQKQRKLNLFQFKGDLHDVSERSRWSAERACFSRLRRYSDALVSPGGGNAAKKWVRMSGLAIRKFPWSVSTEERYAVE